MSPLRSTLCVLRATRLHLAEGSPASQGEVLNQTLSFMFSVPLTLTDRRSYLNRFKGLTTNGAFFWATHMIGFFYSKSYFFYPGKFLPGNIYKKSQQDTISGFLPTSASHSGHNIYVSTHIESYGLPPIGVTCYI